MALELDKHGDDKHMPNLLEPGRVRDDLNNVFLSLFRIYYMKIRSIGNHRCVAEHRQIVSCLTINTIYIQEELIAFIELYGSFVYLPTIQFSKIFSADSLLWRNGRSTSSVGRASVS